MQRQFANRDELINYLKQEFPTIAAQGDAVSPIMGGREAAHQALQQIQPETYGKTRNYLDGSVTHLSPYLRHGVLSLAEVRDAVWAKTKNWATAEPLITQLAWRDFWQRVYAELGDRIYQDLEPIKTGWTAADYHTTLPQDLATGTTGLACMDAFCDSLQTTGYLHNHGRLWLAAYVVHWRRVQWQVGAAWFFSHLLDGDPASNALSWQWVASTFSQKPYIFNRENLERYSQGRYCNECARNQDCPFAASYPELLARLFPQAPELQTTPTRPGQWHRQSRKKSGPKRS